MADEQQQDAPEMDAPQDPAPQDGGTADESDDVRAELDRVRAALKKANAEAKTHRLKNQELSDAQEAARRQAAEEQGKFRELYEAEQARAAQAIADAENLRTQMQNQRISAALTDEARRLGFAEPNDVSSFIGADAIDLDDDGNPANAADLVNELAKSKPYLLTRNSAPNINAQSGSGNAPAPGEMSEDEIRETAAKYGLTIDNVKHALGVN